MVAATAGDRIGKLVPLRRSVSAEFKPRSSLSGRDATSAPYRAMGRTLPLAKRALPATSFGRRLTARAAAVASRRRLARVVATRLAV
eukprot:4718048-Lingulodinium_polyedra.AAC.1